MKLIRAMFFTLAVLLPTSWTIAHAEGTGGSSGETKKSKKKSKKGTGARREKNSRAIRYRNRSTCSPTTRARRCGCWRRSWFKVKEPAFRRVFLTTSISIDPIVTARSQWSALSQTKQRR